MGSMQPAVLEFDEAVQVPWRPPLAGGSARRPAHLRPVAAAPARPVPASRPGPATRPIPAIRPVPGPRVPVPRSRDPIGPDRRRPGGDRSVRLTRRGRLLLVVLSLAVGLAIGALVGSWLGGGTHGALRLAGDSSVVVQSGDTLWSVATSVAGDDDVRDVVEQIRQLNHLDGTVLQPGQVLRLP